MCGQHTIDYFIYGRIAGIRILKGENINYQEDEENNYTKKLLQGKESNILHVKIKLTFTKAGCNFTF